MAQRELKMCLPGDTGVGKSSIVWRFVEDSFDPNINPTIGASFMTKTVQYQNELHKFLIWDTAGQERFRTLAPMYYRGSAAAIIVYDVTKEDSFQALKNWVKELRQHGPPNIVVAIAGNKCDLSDARLNDSPTQGTSTAEPTVYLQTFGSNNVNIPRNSNCRPLRLSVGDTLEDVYVMSLKHARLDERTLTTRVA
ncbi:ras-related protein Rab-22A isoform X1 [Salvelinus fontinalis]|uniref:ras-related protein Rab-22A isoform X1 n=1 Tax=Salvelinus fontinalis TaxID=8038 RepID=UPI002486BB4D|nr:ras-related protein Rab-22A isoform X1 [Salvelinus fontinalis]